MRPQDFYTRSKASQGVRVELVDPAGNREWMQIRSVHSAEFKAAVDQSWRDLSDLQPDGCRKESRRKRNARQACALIAESSLPPEVDLVDLLIKNPRLRRQIERTAEDHSLFFGAQA